MDQTLFNYLHQNKGITERLQTLFDYHYNQIEQEIRQLIPTEDQSDIIDSMAYYMEEVLNFPPASNTDNFIQHLANFTEEDSFKQALIQSLYKRGYDEHSKIIKTLTDPEGFEIDPTIFENLIPNGRPICLLLSHDNYGLYFEGTLETILLENPDYWKQCFKDPDHGFTYQNQEILITED